MCQYCRTRGVISATPAGNSDDSRIVSDLNEYASQDGEASDETYLISLRREGKILPSLSTENHPGNAGLAASPDLRDVER